MIVVRCPYVPERGSQKRKTADLRKKNALRLKKVCYKVSLCETVRGKVVRHSLALLTVQK